ncbi:nitrate- and nitrite sensing domain-containing protein [Pseudoalteromonas sp. MMG013]|uniref:nitrate- and nitrite sensing domain-containing protein n=1 Tax=Pseudoalteromonas sp. MMG013 TaxID=2822687 RepID=UPI001B3811A9|nr:nitrate- and nitrite sensing domain-containing protein [Pseudoalteromonas sp. MMG013]MBQ4862170.1 nitrate- and nitrite sensing domain-containing protein [Pseudoalteromonas sp. MMG013]
MGMFNNLKLRWKLLLIALIPLGFMVFFAFNQVSNNQKQEAESANLLLLTQLSVISNEFVHEMQKERGLTAGFLGSNGTKFQQQIMTQRQDTDKAAKNYDNFVSKINANTLNRDLIRQLDLAKSLKQQLNEKRESISALSIQTSDAIGYYTQSNAAFLGIINFLAKLSTQSDIVNAASAYRNFLNSKELAGVERAVFTAVFASNEFKPGQYERLRNLITIQDTYLEVYVSLATPANLQFYQDTMQNKAVEETQKMRDIAFSKVSEGNFGIDPAYWFEMQTNKINLLKKVSDKLSVDLATKSGDSLDQAEANVFNAMWLMIVSISVTLGFVFFVLQRITGPINNAVTIAQEISKDNLDNRIVVDTSDEAGQLLNALSSMQTSLLKSRSELQQRMQLERKQAAENNRLKQALDNVSANVVVADASNTVIYQNFAAQALFRSDERALQSALSSFSAINVVGRNVAELHPNSSHFGKVLHGLNSTHSEELTLGHKTLNYTLNPVISDEQKKLGVVLELQDLTQQRDAEAQVQGVIEAAVNGQLDKRLESQHFNGSMKHLADSINELLEAIVGPLQNTANAVRLISQGDVPEQNTAEYKGDFAILTDNLNTCILVIGQLIKDVNLLASAAVAGDLKKRVDLSKHNGDFKKIVSGVNNMMDAMVGPLSKAATVVDAISDGAIPSHITEPYNGDFDHLKNNLNTCIDAVGRLIDDANSLANSASNGDLTARADIEQHQGDFKEIMNGVNTLLEAVVAPIDECKHVMMQMARGDLTQQMSDTYQGDFALLSNSINASLDNLSSVIQGVMNNAQQTDQSSSELSSAVVNLSQRTEQQAAALEETRSVMGELTESVSSNAAKAKNANQLSSSTQQQAENGFKVMKGAVESMEEITEASKRITDIIGVIDEIAFQTNLLALNAAVEAARAGDQGKGFAVVAGEVRALAQRSASAAKEIKDLIRASVDKVSIGTTLVNQSGETLNEILAAAQDTSKMVAEIADISENQNDAIEQVNKAILQMDKMTQQNAAMAEEASATAVTMADQASNMKQQLSRFTT